MNLNLHKDIAHLEKPENCKRVISLILGCQANGFKLKTLVNLMDGHKVHGPVPQNRNIILTSTPSGRLNGNVTSTFITRVLKPHLERFRLDEGFVFLSNYWGFRNEAFKQIAIENNISSLYFPLNCNEELNPAYYWIQEFKENFLGRWNRLAQLGRSGKKGFFLWPGYSRVRWPKFLIFLR